MKKTLCATIAGFLLGVLLCGGVLAADILARPADSKVTVDGKDVTVSAYNIQDANYFKLRDFAAAVDVGVWFDQANNTIRIETDKKYDANYTGPGSEDPTAPVYSRSSPAPLGTAQTIAVKTYTSDYTATVSIDEVIRGEEAWKLLKEANLFNSEAKEGMEYVLVKATTKLDKVADGKAVSLSQFSFDVFSKENVEYTGISFAVTPEPKFSGDVYESGTLTGYFAFQVEKTDDAPKLVFARNTDGTGGIWFGLSE